MDWVLMFTALDFPYVSAGRPMSKPMVNIL